MTLSGFGWITIYKIVAKEIFWRTKKLRYGRGRRFQPRAWVGITGTRYCLPRTEVQAADRFWGRPNADFEMPRHSSTNTPLVATHPPGPPPYIFFAAGRDMIWGPVCTLCTTAHKGEYSKSMTHHLADLFSSLVYIRVFLQSDKKSRMTKRKSERKNKKRGLYKRVRRKDNNPTKWKKAKEEKWRVPKETR